MFHPSIRSGPTPQQPLDVSSLLGQLSAAGLLAQEARRPEPEPELVMPKMSLVLDELKVKSDYDYFKVIAVHSFGLWTLFLWSLVTDYLPCFHLLR